MGARPSRGVDLYQKGAVMGFPSVIRKQRMTGFARRTAVTAAKKAVRKIEESLKKVKR
jgi:hypothetical protein